MTVAMLAVVAGCSSGGEAASSCAGVVRYENRDYLPTGDKDFTIGERLGTAHIPECDDTPNDPEVAIPEGTTPPRPSPSGTRPPGPGSWRSAEHTPKRDWTDPPALQSRSCASPVVPPTGTGPPAGTPGPPSPVSCFPPTLRRRAPRRRSPRHGRS
ncbi:DUF6281 family protein [Streptomyces sp. NPDC003015]